MSTPQSVDVLKTTICPHTCLHRGRDQTSFTARNTFEQSRSKLGNPQHTIPEGQSSRGKGSRGCSQQTRLFTSERKPGGGHEPPRTRRPREKITARHGGLSDTAAFPFPPFPGALDVSPSHSSRHCSFFLLKNGVLAFDRLRVSCPAPQGLSRRERNAVVPDGDTKTTSRDVCMPPAPRARLCACLPTRLSRTSRFGQKRSSVRLFRVKRRSTVHYSTATDALRRSKTGWRVCEGPSRHPPGAADMEERF